jgi:excisionase family DNA binding protein
MPKPKDVLTTGEVARICNVAPRTVSKWFDSGQLRGYRIPGGKDRRIPLNQLLRFMEAHGIPLNGLDTGRQRIVVVDPDEEFARALADSLAGHPQYEASTAASAFEAGIVVQECKPHVLLIDVSLPGMSAKELCRVLRGHEWLSLIKLIAIGAGLADGRGQALLQDGFDAFLSKPFDVRQLLQAVERTTSSVR